MILKLIINYRANEGEWLYVNVRKPNGCVERNKMIPYPNGDWSVLLHAEPTRDSRVEYYYSVCNGNDLRRAEWQTVCHSLDVTGDYVQFTSYDRWIEMPEDAHLYSSAFTDCIHNHGKSIIPLETSGKTLRLKVHAPQLKVSERLMLVGDDDALGAWDTNRAIVMYQQGNNEWMASIDASLLKRQTIEFKFVAVNKENPHIQHVWEEGYNRQLVVPEIKDHELVVVEQSRVNLFFEPERFAGTAIPVFSLRSEGSFGVGDFGDLKLMIDWVAKTQQKVLQVLPINDTTLRHTWQDCYPYSCVSIYALHPQYTDFRQMPPLKDADKAAEFEALRKELNALQQIDYERVNNAKNEMLRLLYAQESKKVFATVDFQQWFKEEEEWLVPYAQYSVLRDKYGTPVYSEWPDHNHWDEADREALVNPRKKDYKDYAFYYYQQYVLATQMKSAHEYARQNNVVLKGDIPIGVNRNGCDAWMEPKYFNLNGQTGAPPDDFSTNGQNWGFPTYNWNEMLKNDCAWWVRRFSNMAKYFDAYRIDHVLGFFRIWEIPVHSVHGLLGQFAPALGMTISEIEGYGLKWNEELFTTPYITDDVLDKWFYDKADYVRQHFVEPKHDGFYRMKPEFDTQRKVEAYFAEVEEKGGDGIADNNMRDALYALISNVLFLHDHTSKGFYHPRIASQYDPVYEMLDDKDKSCYNNLYNDYFYRRNNQFWYTEAMKKLPRLVNATRMLVCAEDLGMVPECVAWVMDELKTLTLAIQSMPKEYNVRFGHLSHNAYRSVCTISSHDTATMRMWWDEDEERTEDYYHNMLHRGGSAPHPMPAWLARDIIYRHLACPSMLCVLTLQDWLAIDEDLRLADANAERINIPANPKHYWRYRMHLNIEQLLASDKFNDEVVGLIKETRG